MRDRKSLVHYDVTSNLCGGKIVLNGNEGTYRTYYHKVQDH
jgi:hypothetical protein